MGKVIELTAQDRILLFKINELGWTQVALISPSRQFNLGAEAWSVIRSKLYSVLSFKSPMITVSGLMFGQNLYHLASFSEMHGSIYWSRSQEDVSLFFQVDSEEIGDWFTLSTSERREWLTLLNDPSI